MLASQNFTIRTQKLAGKARATATKLTESGVLYQEARLLVFGNCFQICKKHILSGLRLTCQALVDNLKKVYDDVGWVFAKPIPQLHSEPCDPTVFLLQPLVT